MGEAEFDSRIAAAPGNTMEITLKDGTDVAAVLAKIKDHLPMTRVRESSKEIDLAGTDRQGQDAVLIRSIIRKELDELKLVFTVVTTCI